MMRGKVRHSRVRAAERGRQGWDGRDEDEGIESEGFGRLGKMS